MRREFASVNKNYVLVRPLLADEVKSRGGIVLTTSYDDGGPNFGEVVAEGVDAAQIFNNDTLMSLGSKVSLKGSTICYPVGVSTVVYLDPSKKSSEHALLEAKYILGVVNVIHETEKGS